MSQTRMRVGVPVATGWTSPGAPRDEDVLAVADQPDIAGWLAGLTLEGRLGLHDRTLTQLLEGEPVQLVEEDGDWVRVAALWQPAIEGGPGYLCWVRRAHLREETPDDPNTPPARLPADRVAIMEAGFRHLGLPYLWGGTSEAGLDCSGLVHLTYREAGVIVPRDADAQAKAAQPVEPGAERAGDLYFFGPSADAITHVGFVTAPGELLHSPEDTDVPGAGRIEHAPLTERLKGSTVAIGRFLT